MRADGTLFLGGAETMIGIDDGWQRHTVAGSSFYRPKR
jgi:chemotaxis methyl-accepting protein methylase